jgi:hypothetical protein
MEQSQMKWDETIRFRDQPHNRGKPDCAPPVSPALAAGCYRYFALPKPLRGSTVRYSWLIRNRRMGFPIAEKNSVNHSCGRWWYATRCDLGHPAVLGAAGGDEAEHQHIFAVLFCGTLWKKKG